MTSTFVTEGLGGARGFRSVANPPRLASLLPLLAFAGLVGVAGFRHEAWVDEAQAWLIARDSTLLQLVAYRYEGTPILWHALLWVLAHAGFPYAGLWLVSWALATFGATIVMCRAPFPLWLRLGAIFSYFFAYQYAVVARSYALDLVLFPLFAATFSARLRQPVLYCVLLGVTANGNVHGFIVASVLFAEFVLAHIRNGGWRQRPFIVAATVVVVCIIAAMLHAWPPADDSFSALQQPPIDPGRGWLMFREGFLDRIDIWSAAQPSESSALWGARLSLLLLIPSCILFLRAGTLVLAATCFACLIAFSVLKVANAWHGGMLYLVWLVLLWISWDSLLRLAPMLRGATLVSIAAIIILHDAYTFAAMRREIVEPYSAGSAAAAYLAAARREQPGLRVSAAGMKTFAIQPWFESNQFANYKDGAPGVSYYTWRISEPFESDPHFDTWLDTVASTYDILVLSTSGMSSQTIERYRAVAAAEFCDPRRIPGGLIWKSYVREDDSLLIFERCAMVGFAESPGESHVTRID